MSKICRNDPCPCGSGKKYKKCHGAPAPVTSAAPVPDQRYFSKALGGWVNSVPNMVKKRFEEEIPIISTKFDSLYAEDIGNIDVEISRILFLHLRGAESPLHQHEKDCMLLLANATYSVMACLELMRTGYWLQAGNLLRYALESCAYSFYLSQNPQELKTYWEGDLKRGPVEKFTKERLPDLNIGRTYGDLSNFLSHVNPVHRMAPQFLRHDAEQIETVALFPLVRRMIDVIGIVQELTILRFMEEPRFWTRNADKTCTLNPEAKKRRIEFIRGKRKMPPLGDAS